MVVSSEDLTPVRDQTPHLATVSANSSARSAAPVLQALAQLSRTMILLIGAGEAERARVAHDAIGKLLVPQEGSCTAERAADMTALGARSTSTAGID